MKPAEACATCNTTAWRRFKGHRVWHCETCRRGKSADVYHARRESRAAEQTAALLTKRDALPAWQRPIYRGDEQDMLIWKFFTMERMRMNMIAEGRSWDLKGQAHDLIVRAGLLRRITERERLFSVLCHYGKLVAHGEDVGDVEHPPWWEPGKSPFTRR